MKILTTALMALAAQQQAGAPVTTFPGGIFVTTADVTACPYTVLGTITTHMKPDPLWEAAPDIQESFEGLSNKARKMGADAVLLVKRGGEHVSLFRFRSITVTGRAVRFTDRACVPKQ